MKGRSNRIKYDFLAKPLVLPWPNHDGSFSLFETTLEKGISHNHNLADYKATWMTDRFNVKNDSWTACKATMTPKFRLAEHAT